jgi:hypothetical protein
MVEGVRITEIGDTRISESGDFRVTENYLPPVDVLAPSVDVLVAALAPFVFTGKSVVVPSATIAVMGFAPLTKFSANIPSINIAFEALAASISAISLPPSARIYVIPAQDTVYFIPESIRVYEVEAS